MIWAVMAVGALVVAGVTIRIVLNWIDKRAFRRRAFGVRQFEAVFAIELQGSEFAGEQGRLAEIYMSRLERRAKSSSLMDAPAPFIRSWRQERIREIETREPGGGAMSLNLIDSRLGRIGWMNRRASARARKARSASLALLAFGVALGACRSPTPPARPSTTVS